jgi:hypothetical protein
MASLSLSGLPASLGKQKSLNYLQDSSGFFLTGIKPMFI